MSHLEHPPGGFRPLVGLCWLGGVAVFGVSLSAVYAATGIGLVCPFRALTGWACPFCGGTRLGSALLNGDLAAAFGYNQLVFVSLVVATAVGALWVVELVGGPVVRPPAVVDRALRAVDPTRWVLLGLAVLGAFAVLRNVR